MYVIIYVLYLLTMTDYDPGVVVLRVIDRSRLWRREIRIATLWFIIECRDIEKYVYIEARSYHIV